MEQRDMEQAYIHTEHMAVGYRGRTLLREIGLHVHRGEIVTLIGPNGAGKSTILKSIIGQLGLLEGAVFLDGTSMEQMTEKETARKLSILMTERIRPERMTCGEVAAAGRYPYTGRLGILTEEDREKVEEALELVHALELADQDFLKVSDGQRQRVLLARAICQEPEAIVLDEPTSFLDIRHKLELLAILKRLVREKHVAVLMALHELDLAQRISDYVVCVSQDAIERCGTPEEIFTSDYIEQLYDIREGSYQAELGFPEMEPAGGTPQVFVIGGNGSGIPVYRKLCREGIPFAAGVLAENDVEYPVAKALAACVIAEKPFEPVGEETLAQAEKVLRECREVICTLEHFGTMNAGNQRLLESCPEKVVAIPGNKN